MSSVFRRELCQASTGAVTHMVRGYTRRGPERFLRILVHPSALPPSGGAAALGMFTVASGQLFFGHGFSRSPARLASQAQPKASFG